MLLVRDDLLYVGIGGIRWKLTTGRHMRFTDVSTTPYGVPISRDENARGQKHRAPERRISGVAKKILEHVHMASGVLREHGWNRQ